MKIGVSSYSFSRLVRSGEMAQIDVIAKTKEIGFDVIEFSAISVPEGKNLPDYAKELREEADKVGIDIVNYTIGADFLRGSNGDVQAEIERVKGEVDVAEILGVPGMRHDASGGWPADHVGPPEAGRGLPGCHRVRGDKGDQDDGRKPRPLLPGQHPRGAVGHRGRSPQLWSPDRHG